MSEAIRSIPAFSGPSAMDLYNDFTKRYGAVIEKRRTELKAILDAARDAEPTAEISLAFAELDSIQTFEPELHRLIHAFTAEAVKPLQEVLMDIAMRTPGPFIGGTS